MESAHSKASHRRAAALALLAIAAIATIACNGGEQPQPIVAPAPMEPSAPTPEPPQEPPALSKAPIGNTVQFSLATPKVVLADDSGHQIALQVDASRPVERDVEIQVDVPSELFGVSRATISIPAGQRSGITNLPLPADPPIGNQYCLSISPEGGATGSQRPGHAAVLTLTERDEHGYRIAPRPAPAPDLQPSPGPTPRLSFIPPDPPDPPPEGDPREGAAPLTLGVSVEAEIALPGEYDYFRLEVETDSIVIISTTGPTATAGGVLNSEAQSVFTEHTFGEGDNFRIEAGLAEGTYFVGVKHAAPGGTGPYTLRAAVNRWDDHGSTPASATPLAPNEVILSDIPYRGDIDLFRLDIETSSLIAIRADGWADTHVQLLDSSGNPTTFPRRGNAPRVAELLAYLEAGTHFVQVDHFNGRIGAYSVQTTALPFRELVLNQRVSGSIAYEGSDHFRLQVPRCGPVAIRADGIAETGGELFDGAGNLIAEDYDIGSRAKLNIETVLAPGTYFMRLEHAFNSRTGSYTLLAEQQPAAMEP